MHGRFLLLAARMLLACLPAAVLVMAIGTASATRTPGGTRAEALAALKHLLLGRHGTNQALLTRTPTQSTSANWSGYADTGTTFSKVSGSWTQPAVRCTSTVTVAVFWAGIDGFSSQTVEQDGSLAFCSGHRASYYTWWEMFPANSVQLVGSTVKPGDHIVASVAETGTTYTLKVTDSTTPGNNVLENESCAAATCIDSSAEWIAEAPQSNGSFLPLANFGSWTMTNAAVSGGGVSGTISSFADDAITMVDGTGNVEAQPGPLNAKGNQFKVTWKAST